MKVEVTETDIQNGVRGDSMKCPTALAVKRELPTCKVEVEYFHIWIDDQPYLCSHNIRMFIWDFDNNRPVKPFSFDLDLDNFKAL